MEVVYSKIQEQLIEESFYSRSTHLSENLKSSINKNFFIKEIIEEKENLSKNNLHIFWNKKELIKKILDRKME